MKMTRTKAVLEFLNTNTSKPVPNSEFMEFWKVCSSEERAEYATYAARAIGAEIIE